MLITATSDSVTKENMTVTDPAAGALAPAAGALVLWIGATATSPVEAVGGLETCMDALVEEGAPAAAYGAEIPVGAGSSNVVVAAGAPTVTDNDVAIAYGASFKEAGTTVEFKTTVRRAIEKYLEAAKDE